MAGSSSGTAGSQGSGVAGGTGTPNITVSSEAPEDPEVGDIWIETDE